MGADRWIYEGWKDAFTDLGHNIETLTMFDDFKKKIESYRPNIFMTSISKINFDTDPQIYRQMRDNGCKVCVEVLWPLIVHGEMIIKYGSAKKAMECFLHEDFADVYFGEREPEGMADFQQATGKIFHSIPNAANKKLHYPVAPVEKYAYDIVFLGAKLPLKRWFNENVLLPLRKKYKVGIFGPYWTLKDNLLRGCSRLARNMKLKSAANLFESFRITVPIEEENALYSSAKICLNFHEREKDGTQSHIILNQRTFKICACGGFQICDEIPPARKHFTEDELVMAKIDVKDWFDKIDYYLKNEKRRKEIQQNGTARALKDHTYHNRVQQLLSLL